MSGGIEPHGPQGYGHNLRTFMSVEMVKKPWPQIFPSFKFNFPENFSTEIFNQLTFPSWLRSQLLYNFIYKGKAGRGNTQLFLFFLTILDKNLTVFCQIFRFYAHFRKNSRETRAEFPEFVRFSKIFQRARIKKERNLSVSLSIVIKRGARQSLTP